jgi:hypothetical protein
MDDELDLDIDLSDPHLIGERYVEAVQLAAQVVAYAVHGIAHGAVDLDPRGIGTIAPVGAVADARDLATTYLAGPVAESAASAKLPTCEGA